MILMAWKWKDVLWGGVTFCNQVFEFLPSKGVSRVIYSLNQYLILFLWKIEKCFSPFKEDEDGTISDCAGTFTSRIVGAQQHLVPREIREKIWVSYKICQMES